MELKTLYKDREESESENHLTGDYKGVHFEQADVHSWTYYRKREHNKIETYFYGRMFIFDLPVRNIQSVKVLNKLPLNAKNDYAFHNMSFHFKGSKLYFTMECDNRAFDAGKFPISYPDEKKKLEADIQVIIDLIEALDLIDKNALNEKEMDEPALLIE